MDFMEQNYMEDLTLEELAFYPSADETRLSSLLPSLFP